MVNVFVRLSKSLRPADVGSGQQSSPFLVLRAETTVTSILNVCLSLFYAAYSLVPSFLKQGITRESRVTPRLRENSVLETSSPRVNSG